ncbi:MAG: alpha-galactosidase [Pseudomonadota bacterium]
MAQTLQGWRLQNDQQCLILAARDGRLPQVVHWGGPMPDVSVETLLAAQQPDVTGGMLDEAPELSICPETSRTFPGQPGLIVQTADGAPIRPLFSFQNAEEQGDTLTLTYRDQANRLIYRAHFALQGGILEARAELQAEDPVRVIWLAAPAMPGPQLSDEMMDVAGRWCGEFQLNHIPWSAGGRLRENPTGRTGHEHFPGLLIPARGATNTKGEVWAFHYGWSGGHRMVAEELPDGRRQVQFGHAAGSEQALGTRFETAPLYLSYSSEGSNGCATAFQRHVRDRIVTWPKASRPVHYNCWETVYFDHSLDALCEIADRAADLGAERFVLDDGWFGRRDSDTTSLGDWQVDPRKYPDGLGPLIDHVHTCGMSFGLWFEPEMVNPDSDLQRTHPEWVLGPASQPLGRQQLVLDMARDDVRDHLFQVIGAILHAHDIDYIKWDHNRVLPVSDAAQCRGTYDLIDRLRAAFPQVEIESCASGGGRIDYGILSRTQRVWLSDSNDALERLRIQHDAALFLPLAVTGSHVGPRHCHTSGRTLDIAFRAWVAAQRHMGFEMDPRELTDREEAVLRKVTAWWKTNRDWLIAADILRLDSADPAVLAEQHLSQDGARFVAFAGKAATSAQITPRPLRLTRLDPDAIYRVDLANRDEIHTLSRGTPQLKSGPVDLPGAWLMQQGVTLPWSPPETMWVIEGTKL